MRKKESTGGILCPNCGKHIDGRVIDARFTQYGRRRRRVCELCGKRFTTIERPVNGEMLKVLFGGLRNGNKQA